IQPKVGAEIDERDAPIENRRRDPLAVPVRKRREDKIDPVERSLVERLDARFGIGRRQMRMDAAERLARLAVAEQLRGRARRMRGKQAQQLAADIARSSKDGRPNHRAATIRYCMIMQINAYSYDEGYERAAPASDCGPHSVGRARQPGRVG